MIKTFEGDLKEIKDVLWFYGHEHHYRGIIQEGVSAGETLVSQDAGKKAREILRTYFNKDIRDKWGDA